LPRSPARKPGGRSQTIAAPEFPIVGIGASAGGLEAFTRLLAALPPDTGLAFVLVQHLDPKHDGMLTTLLSHTTAMPVVETLREPLLVLDPDLRVKSANRTFHQIFRTNPQATVGRFVHELCGGQWNIPRLRTLLEEILPKNAHCEGFEGAAGGRSERIPNSRRLKRADGQTQMVLLAMEEKKGTHP